MTYNEVCSNLNIQNMKPAQANLYQWILEELSEHCRIMWKIHFGWSGISGLMTPAVPRLAHSSIQNRHWPFATFHHPFIHPTSNLDPRDSSLGLWEKNVDPWIFITGLHPFSFSVYLSFSLGGKRWLECGLDVGLCCFSAEHPSCLCSVITQSLYRLYSSVAPALGK